jgi:hypothetical protein
MVPSRARLVSPYQIQSLECTLTRVGVFECTGMRERLGADARPIPIGSPATTEVGSKAYEKNNWLLTGGEQNVLSWLHDLVVRLT